MTEFLNAINKILTTPPGNIVVYLALSISVMAALQVVLMRPASSPPALRRRMLLGLSMILLGQVTLFIISGFAWQQVINPNLILPPLTQAVTCWCLIWIVWLWSFPLPNRPADVINLLSNLIVAIFFFFSLSAWSNQPPGTSFNGTWLDWGWGLLSIFVILTGVLYLLLERPLGWGVGLGILGINLAGFVIHLAWADPNGDYSGAVALAQLCSYPLLPSLTQRLNPVQPYGKDGENTFVKEKRLYTADPNSIYTWVQVAVQTRSENLRIAISHAVAQSMLADICYLAQAPIGPGDIIIPCGYDQVRDEALPGTVLTQAKAPILAGALQYGRPFRLGGNGHPSADLDALAAAVGLENPGNLLFIPLASNKSIWGGLLLLSPYSNREWSVADQTYMVPATESIITILEKAERNQLEIQEEKNAQTEIDKLKERTHQLQVENEALMKGPGAARTIADIEALLLLQQESQNLIANLQTENQQLHVEIEQQAEALQKDNPDASQIESELQLTLEEMARLQNAVAGANMKILALEMQTRQSSEPLKEGQEIILTIIQELRQPLTSLIGYTDLLMNDSIGNMGALQKTFLERMQAATDQLVNIVSGLIKITTLEGNSLELPEGLVDMNDVIDGSINQVSRLIEEKEITIQVDLGDDLPHINADQDALEQILIQLLSNAITVTPADGVITLNASRDESEGQTYILVQVTDSGGGIAFEDLPRVFWRNYRSENSPIPGVGDTGIGLSIARTLSEALGGRIWVDSIPQKSSTFSVLLPVDSSRKIILSELNESIP